MPAYKTTFFFEGLQPSFGTTASSVVSWTETWYQDSASVDAAVSFAQEQTPNSWIRLRVGFMHSAYCIKWVRCSNDINPRETKLAHIPGAPQGALNAPEGTGSRILLEGDYDTCAQINCCVLVDFATLPAPGDTRTHHRRTLLRGLARSMIHGNVVQTVGAAFNALGRFCDMIGRGRSPNFPAQGAPGRWMIRYQSPAQSFQPISALTIQAGNPRQILVTAPLPAANDGERIAIRSVIQPGGVNRIWTVRGNAPLGGPYILQRSRRPIVGDWILSGSANLIRPVYRPPNQYTIIGLRTKHTGSGIFGRTRGRRQAR